MAHGVGRDVVHLPWCPGPTAPGGHRARRHRDGALRALGGVQRGGRGSSRAPGSAELRRAESEAVAVGEVVMVIRGLVVNGEDLMGVVSS